MIINDLPYCDFMRVCLGGTFDILHKGHKKLISEAFRVADDKGFVFIGLSDEKLLENKKNTKIWQMRKKNLEKFILENNYSSDFEILPINDIYGPTLEDDFDVIIVSTGSEKNARKINEKRKELGKKPLKIFTIPYVLSEDGKPISTTRIKNNEIDKEGNILQTRLILYRDFYYSPLKGDTFDICYL